jgi:hypothetical protein
VEHQLLEDRLAGGEGLGCRFGCLEIGAFGRQRASRGRDLGGFGRSQIGRATGRRCSLTVIAARAIVAARWAIVAARAIVTTRPIVARAVIARGVLSWSVVAGSVVASGSVIARAVVARAVVAWPGRWREWDGRGGFALRGCAAECRTGRSDDPGGLRAHAQDASAAGRQDLEVEVVQVRTEGLAGEFQGLFDGLAGEFAVFAHS